MKRLSEIAYYKTGGTFDRLIRPKSIAELSREIARSQRDRLLVIGAGTNSLVMDEHWPGAVVLFDELNTLEFKGGSVAVGAGVENLKFSMEALTRGLAGAAWMYRLPGQIGGTVRMNARCYGGEISQIVQEVTTVSRDGTVRAHKSSDGIFKGYKDTVFMQNSELIAQVKIELNPGEVNQIHEKMKACESDRVAKGQFLYPTCGCVFKNHYEIGVSSGILLDEAGAKDLKFGGAEVNPQHANFVYNKGATSREILELSFQMRDKVWDKFGCWLDYEMEVLGEIPKDLVERFKEKRVHKMKNDVLEPIRARFKRKMEAAE